MEELQLKKILHNFPHVSESGVYQYVILVNKEMLGTTIFKQWSNSLIEEVCCHISEPHSHPLALIS